MPEGNWSWLISGATYAGLGALLSGPVVAAVQAWGRKSESRATAANIVTDAASDLVKQYVDMNRELRDQIRQQTTTNRKQREALIKVIDVIDDIITTLHLEGPPADKLKAASKVARDSI